MKNYTSQFLIVTLITGLLGFTGLEFTGSSIVRFVFLISVVGLLVSCLDAVLISTNMKKLRFKNLRNKLRNQ
ncbi:hypothetical protein ULMS_12550 [Patiriisocius marinistellae]|uniref:DUF1328 domain-containing protein n=1 Tax=Patiriisocius marinistellae TaxID=2494560 RepID=A0A5J4FTF1_9FLAO|nr:DUF1328 domain-containing protein [Patiriisocius marinistellae]GEQ85747.1 hypothetical protein ULMS_12550 [Patiriisocius marinistellae]